MLTIYKYLQFAIFFSVLFCGTVYADLNDADKSSQTTPPNIIVTLSDDGSVAVGGTIAHHQEEIQQAFNESIKRAHVAGQAPFVLLTYGKFNSFDYDKLIDILKLCQQNRVTKLVFHTTNSIVNP
jgi:biopolymer transport protein ExbD